MADVFPPLQPALADRYLIERELGRGGMATVYLAQDLKHHRQVAIKVLKPELAAALGPERFLREIEIAAGLTHPHVLPLHESGEAAGFLYYVMPFVDGETLRARLNREQQLPLEEAVQIAREVADALSYAHGRDVVHRDIKPENILLSGGHAVVADFGIARAISVAGRDKFTATGMVVGTPAYMSPEQASGQSRIDGRADIYALGCMLYEMLAGDPPFLASTPQAVLARQALDPVPRLRTVRQTVPRSVEQAITKALAKVAADRFATAAQFAEALIAVAPAVGEVGPENSIVVLDFTNISGDPGLDWLSSGIAETVSVDLKKIAGLQIINHERAARALAGREKGAISGNDILSVGRALGARWVVWGGFQNFGSVIRITPQFAETETEELISAAKIDGPIQDIFALQDRIVTGLMGILNVKLSSHDLERIGKPQTAQLQAYEYYAKGRQLFTLFGTTSLEQAAEYFEHAIAIDPAYALAYSGLGSTFGFRYIARTRKEDLSLAITHLERALELDPDLFEPYGWLAYAYTRAYRFDEGQQAADRAVALEPESTFSHYFAGLNRVVRGAVEHRWELYPEAAPMLVRAIAVEPNFQPAYIGLGWIYMLNGQYNVARVAFDRAVEIEETGRFKEIRFVGGLTLRAGLDLREARWEDARGRLRRALEHYEGTDHVYAEAFTALSYCGLAEIEEQAGNYDRAVEHYTRAGEIIAQHPHRLGVGYLRVKAGLGLARTFHRLHMRRDEVQQVNDACRLLEHKQDYDFNWMWEGSDAQAQYDLARYRAAAGHREEALQALRRAVTWGWGDWPLLEADDGFARYRDDPELASVRDLVRARRLPDCASLADA
ncbi:MAG: hypothetical protein DMD31_07350 [Gemmatimonadetes bacterium]|nr:MAG: hypothetical protein DMD31_07350 [Gemmatimonadota bacterium]